MKSISLLDEYLTIGQVKTYLNISQSAAYALTHDKDFPVCRLGSSIRIPRKPFLAWVEVRTSIPVHLCEYMNRMKEVI